MSLKFISYLYDMYNRKNNISNNSSNNITTIREDDNNNNSKQINNRKSFSLLDTSSPSVSKKQNDSSSSSSSSSSKIVHNETKIVNGKSISKYRSKNRSSSSSSSSSAATKTNISSHCSNSSSSKLKRKHQSSSSSSSLLSSKNRYNHYNYHYYNNHNYKNGEKLKSSIQQQQQQQSLLDNTTVVKKLKNSNYKIPKNRSSTSILSSTTTTTTTTINDDNHSNNSDFLNYIKHKDDDTNDFIYNKDEHNDETSIDDMKINKHQKSSPTPSLIKNNERNSCNVGKLSPSSSSSSKIYAKAKQLCEQNEKLLNEFKKSNISINDPNRQQKESDEIETLKLNFNSTQWSLEERLSLLIKQQSELKLELKIFQLWLRDESNSNNKKKNTFSSFEKFYKERRDQERIKQHNLRGLPLNDLLDSFESSSEIAKRQYYHEKLKLNDQHLFDSIISSTASTKSSTNSNDDVDDNHKCNNINNNADDNNVINNCKNNWEIVSLEHAFNAFSSETFQTTKPKIKYTSANVANANGDDYDEEEDGGNDESARKQQSTKSNRKSNLKRAKTIKISKKKSKKIRKKNLKRYNNTSKFSRKYNQQTSHSNQSSDNKLTAGDEEDYEESSQELFSLEKWEKFQKFLSRTVFNIEKHNWQFLQSYLNSTIIDSFKFHSLIENDLHKILPIITRIKYESIAIDTENIPLPAKRRRRSSSKILEYSDNLNLLSSRKNRNNRLNGIVNSNNTNSNSNDNNEIIIMTTPNEQSKSSVTFHMPLMTRTQSKYFYENVINSGNVNENDHQQILSSASFKNVEQLQEYLIEHMTRMDSLKKLKIDINQRHSLLKVLKFIKEFFNYRPKWNHHNQQSNSANNSCNDSNDLHSSNHNNTETTKISYRGVGKRRRSRKRLSTSSETTSQKQNHSTNVKDDKNQRLVCDGIECSMRFDMPNMSFLDYNKDNRPLVKSLLNDHKIDNRVDIIKNDNDEQNINDDFLFDGTMEILNENSNIYFDNDNGMIPSTFFPQKQQTSNDSIVESLNNVSESKQYHTNSNSPRRSNQSFNRQNHVNTSPSKCEMKLRSRSSSSSSNSYQFFSLDDISQDHQQQQQIAQQSPTTTLKWDLNNQSIFKNFIEINIDEVESPTIIDKSRIMMRTRGDTKRFAAAAAAAAAAEAEKKESIKDDNNDNDKLQKQQKSNKFLSIIIEQIQNKLHLLSMRNYSRLMAINEMFCQDYYLEQLENRLEQLDFEVIDLYHQYLFCEKKFTDTQLEHCLKKIDSNSKLTNEFIEKTLCLMSKSPNSQRMTKAFCEQSKLLAILANYSMNDDNNQNNTKNENCSLMKNLFESIMIMINERQQLMNCNNQNSNNNNNNNNEQSKTSTKIKSIINIQKELYKLSKQIDWSLLEKNKHYLCNDNNYDHQKFNSITKNSINESSKLSFDKLFAQNLLSNNNDNCEIIHNSMNENNSTINDLSSKIASTTTATPSTSNSSLSMSLSLLSTSSMNYSSMNDQDDDDDD